jgi:two-component system response regulator (stage 0 sporulation protein F)
MRETLVDILEDLGYSVEVASNGRDAVAKVKSKGFALVLMDLKMPIMGGLRALPEIKRLCPQMPVILMTAYAHSSDVNQAYEQGAHAVVGKPLDIEQVLSIIRQALCHKPA